MPSSFLTIFGVDMTVIFDLTLPKIGELLMTHPLHFKLSSLNVVLCKTGTDRGFLEHICPGCDLGFGTNLIS